MIADIRIIPNASRPGYFKVYLNGEDITRYVTNVRLEMGVGQTPTAHLTLLAELDMPEAVRVLVLVDDKETGDKDRL